MKKKNIILTISAAAASVLALFIVTEPDICGRGAAEGIILSGRVIIPSLFPFTVCVLFLMKSGALNILNFADGFTRRIFGITAQNFSAMLFSFIGGYSTGAKMLNESVREKKISPENAGVLLCCSVNAGPAFVILAVGSSTLGSRKAGYILLTAHIISALILSFFLRFFIKKDNAALQSTRTRISVSDNFVSSVADAAASVMTVCAYVILFSVIGSYIDNLSGNISFLRFVSPLLEVTNGVQSICNIHAISFLLGFAGISIWCQVISVGSLIKFNFPLFAAARIIHGLLSSGICMLLLKIFRITLSVSAGISFKAHYGGAALTVSMASMLLLLLISLFRKKDTGNLLNDIV